MPFSSRSWCSTRSAARTSRRSWHRNSSNATGRARGSWSGKASVPWTPWTPWGWQGYAIGKSPVVTPIVNGPTVERHLPLIQCELNFFMSIFWGATLTCWEWLSSPFISFRQVYWSACWPPFCPWELWRFCSPWWLGESKKFKKLMSSTPHILSDRIISSSHFRFPDQTSEIRVTESRHGFPGDRGRFGSLLVTLEPKTLASEAPTDCFFLDPYSICENIGKQMTDLTWMFFPERQALDHLVLILPALSTALSCDVAETRTSEIGH